MAWEEAKPILRPESVHMGVMKADKEKCTSCGLCIKNCPFSAWEMDEDEHPKLKDVYECFSCYNCMVACPVDAISIESPYHVDDGFWVTEPHFLEAKMPFEPLDAEGKPDQWNAIERAVLERRSVRNFKDTPIPESIIRRVLEAGRFAPSAGNCQPWQFIVITNKELIRKMDEATYQAISGIYNLYRNDELVTNLSSGAESNPGSFDPRLAIGGMGAIAKGSMPASLNAPCVILLAADTRSIGSPQMNIGICGQNMNLVANSLGIKACWVGFLAVGVQAIADKINLGKNWQIMTTMVMGYPAFKQEGIVPREYRPVTWLREGSDEPEID